VPPYRYSVDFGYRSGYELAWRDWQTYGRYNRNWRRPGLLRFGVGYTYRSGYEAGWRDAANYYGRGYRPDYWAFDHGAAGISVSASKAEAAPTGPLARSQAGRYTVQGPLTEYSEWTLPRCVSD
jgi:hypothetical protein